MAILKLFLVLAGVGAAATRPRPQRHHPRRFAAAASDATPGVANCTQSWFSADVDHFSSATNSEQYQQRYFTYDSYWKPGGPIFFYAGNEADVEGYVDATGLMWERAEKLGALLLFAEHRFYGQSWPCGDPATATADCLKYLTHEQALADYAALLTNFLADNDSQASKIVAFGGSYGGMLSYWMRVKYPYLIAGAVAASAPILAFNGGDLDFYDVDGGASYWEIVTDDAKAAYPGLAADACADNVAALFDTVSQMSATSSGRQSLADAFNLCDVPGDDGTRLANQITYQFDNYAMGNYPYPSTYISGANPFPAFPMRAACDFLKTPDLAGGDLLAAANEAMAMGYNNSGVEKCWPLDPAGSEFDGIWDWQWCTQLLPQETYFSRRGGDFDMFPKYTYDLATTVDRCASEYAVAPKPTWISQSYGGNAGVAVASNIVFSNGELDPWRAGGVDGSVVNSTDRDVWAITIPQGAHHLDLMFSNADDPDGVHDARNFEMECAKRWLGLDS